MTRFGELLRSLSDANVEFILIGGIAAVAHGSPRATQDIDLVYRRTPENIRRLVSALSPLEPYLRGAGRPRDLETIAILEQLRDRKPPA